MTVQAITAEILRDRDRVPSSHNVVDCFACGRAFLYKGPSGDDSGRFCHQRCREWFDAGNPPYAPVNVSSVPIRDWKVVAGPPGVNLGASYYGPILDRKRPLRRGQTEPGELIRPRRPCQRCGSSLPVWVKGKAVRKSVKYCEGCRT
jgi:hypothetical protein